MEKKGKNHKEQQSVLLLLIANFKKDSHLLKILCLKKKIGKKHHLIFTNKADLDAHQETLECESIKVSKKY